MMSCSSKWRDYCNPNEPTLEKVEKEDILMLVFAGFHQKDVYENNGKKNSMIMHQHKISARAPIKLEHQYIFAWDLIMMWIALKMQTSFSVCGMEPYMTLSEPDIFGAAKLPQKRLLNAKSWLEISDFWHLFWQQLFTCFRHCKTFSWAYPAKEQS